MKKIFFAVAIFVVALATTGCTKLLLSEPRGDTASQAQVESNLDALEYSLSGLYANMYVGSDMIESVNKRRMIEGQKYIDVVSDLIVSDAACPNARYGWVLSKTRMNQYRPIDAFNRWLWKYEYNNILNANMLIKSCDNFLKNNENATDALKNKVKATRAQAIIMRSHFYSNLFNFYVKPGESSKVHGIIYYDEKNMGEVQGLSEYNVVVTKVIADTKAAIEQIGSLTNASKIGLDANIAKMILAYIHLNRGRYFEEATEATKTESCTEALRLAKEVIAATKATNPILPYEAVLTNGFNNVGSSNWMWGVDVTQETTYGLHSLFGFIDIYTYSYASAGEYVALDKGIYDKFDQMLDAKDRRKEWWNVVGNFYYIPNNKFFDKNRIFQGDRNWTNDYCFMRSEEAYLIAAEAAYALGNEADAKTYLKELVAQRSPDNLTAIDGLTGDALKDYIQNNWRIEMWLEGRTFMALKRFKWEVQRSTNHYYLKDQKFQYSDKQFTFEIPDVETDYNPKL
jgi:hypothetical protein